MSTISPSSSNHSKTNNCIPRIKICIWGFFILFRICLNCFEFILNLFQLWIDKELYLEQCFVFYDGYLVLTDVLSFVCIAIGRMLFRTGKQKTNAGSMKKWKGNMRKGGVVLMTRRGNLWRLTTTIAEGVWNSSRLFWLFPRARIPIPKYRTASH